MCIAAYRVIVAEPNGYARVNERMIGGFGNLERAKEYAHNHTRRTGHTTYVVGEVGGPDLAKFNPQSTN